MHRQHWTRLAGALLAALALTGCPAARRPETPPAPAAPITPAPGPATPAPAAPGVGAGANSAAAAQADALAQAATKVKGVRGAWVVVAGDVAYAGIDVDGPNRVTANNQALEQEVARVLEGAGHGVRKAYVSTKPEVLQSIQNIAEGIRSGQPFGRFASEISKLATEMAPSAD